MMRYLTFLVAGALPVVACSSQVDSRYQGEPLLSVEGRVVATAAPTAPEIDAAIAWIPVQAIGAGTGVQPMRPTLVAARVPVTSSFPMSFRVGRASSPPEEAHIPGTIFGKPAYAFGVLVALSRSATGPGIQPGDVVGVDRHHLVVWVDHEPAPDMSRSAIAAASGARRSRVTRPPSTRRCPRISVRLAVAGFRPAAASSPSPR